MANDLISREAALEIIMKYCPDDDGSCSKADVDPREMLDEIESLPAVDAAPVVRCVDCSYWLDRHVLLNDGTRRMYEPSEDHVTADIGINCGARCMLDADYMGGNGPFRQGEDFCSRGVRKDKEAGHA